MHAQIASGAVDILLPPTENGDSTGSDGDRRILLMRMKKGLVHHDGLLCMCFYFFVRNTATLRWL